MPELVESTRRAFRDDRASPDTCVAEPTFADIATRYLDRHVRRHLVPRAYALALYAHTFLATVEVPAPTGGTVPFPEKQFHLITTDDVEDAIEQKAQPGITTVRRPGRKAWTRTVGGGQKKPIAASVAAPVDNRLSITDPASAGRISST